VQKIEPNQIDSGLTCLAILGQYYQIALEPAQLKHQFGDGEKPFAELEILRAAKAVGFKARAVASAPNRLANTILPAIAQTSDGQYFIIARISEDDSFESTPQGAAPVKILIQEIAQPPRTVTPAEL